MAEQRVSDWVKCFLVAYLAGFGLGAHIALGFGAAAYALRWYWQPVVAGKSSMDSLIQDGRGRLWLIKGGQGPAREVSPEEFKGDAPVGGGFGTRG